MNVNFLNFSIPYRIARGIYNKDKLIMFNSTKTLTYTKSTKEMFTVFNTIKLSKGGINIIQSNNRLLFINNNLYNKFPIIINNTEKIDEKIDEIFNFGVINFGFIDKKENLKTYQIDLDKNRTYDIYTDKGNNYIYLKLNKN